MKPAWTNGGNLIQSNMNSLQTAMKCFPKGKKCHGTTLVVPNEQQKIVEL
jgi:hypothetical protein